MMKEKRNRISYYFYSILIHFFLLVLWVLFIQEDSADIQFEDPYIVEIYTIPRPTIVKPPEPVSLLPPTKLQSSDDDISEKTPFCT